MAAIDDVNAQLVNPNDRINLYEGEGCQSPVQISGADDMRKWLRFLSWDLLRFAAVTLFKGAFNPNGIWGMRDQITRTHLLAELTWIATLRLAEKQGVSVSDLVALVPDPATAHRAFDGPFDSATLHKFHRGGLQVLA